MTVTGQRNDLRTSIDRRSYSVANDLQATSGSVADVLRNVPSVEVDPQGNVSLRGDPSVTIMIDGKPSGMFQGEGRADALQQLPAAQIDRIEVMTNPSAAFRPDGTGGVINLITKKNRRAGRYATVRANLGTGSRYNGGVSGSYTREKVTLSGDAGFRQSREEGTAANERARLAAGQWLESRQRAETQNRGRVFNFRAGVEYDPNPANRLSAEVRHRDFAGESETVDIFEGEDAALTIARAFQRRAEGESQRFNSAASANWRRKFSGQEHDLVADLSYDTTEMRRELGATIDTALPAPPTATFEAIRSRLQQDLTRLKVDYNRPVGEHSRLKTGYEFELAENDYDNFGARGPDSASLLTDPHLTNRFLYQQRVNAVYGTFEKPFGKLTVLAGLRLERVDIDLDQVTMGVTEENDYARGYPSLHLAYELSERQRLTASYSLRTRRPPPEDLNPFIVYIDPFNLRAGNPRLKPQDTHSSEVGWQYRKEQSVYLTTLYYRETKNFITDVYRDLGGGVLLGTRENLGERRSGGVEFVANGRLSKTLTYNASGNVFWEELSASNLGFTERRSGFSPHARVNLNWQPTPKDFFQLNVFMAGRRVLPQGYNEAHGALNLGYRRKVDEKLSLVLSVQDVFGTLRLTSVVDTPTLRDRTERRFSSQVVFVGFSYNFSEGPKKPQREPGFEFETGS